MPIYPNTNIIITDTNSNTTISSNSINTNTINTNSFIVSNEKGATGSILSTNGTNLEWIVPSSGNTITSDINMNTNNIINTNTITCNTLNTTTITGPTTFTNPVTFSIPPVSVTPVNANEMAIKSYTDNVIPSVYNLYMNISVTDQLTGYYILSKTPSSVTNQTILTSSTAGFPGASIGSFISEPIGITQLPISLWNLNIWGTISSLTDPTNYYAKFSLYNNDTTIIITPIGTSTNSANHIALTSTNLPYQYTVNFTLSSTIPTKTTDRILIELFAYKVSGTNTQTVTTYFEAPYYTNFQIQVTNLLNPLSTISLLPNYMMYTDLKMNNYNISSPGDLSISCPNKILSFENSGTTGIFIGTDITVPTNINLLSSGSSGTINMNKRASIIYTKSPTTGQIGEVINVLLPAAPLLPFTTDIEIPVVSQLINPGVWIINACSGFLCTTTGTNIKNISLYIKNGSDLICQQQNNYSNDAIIGTVHILSCGGIVGTLTQTTITLYQIMRFNGGEYRVADANDNFSFTITRIA